jgi:hypothetical protein
MSRMTTKKVLGTASIVSTLAAAILLFIFGANVNSQHRPLSTLGFVAAALQLLTTAIFTYLTWSATIKHSSMTGRPIGSPNRAGERIGTIAGLALFILAGAASVAAFIWTKVLLTTASGPLLGQPTPTLLTCTFVLWILSAILQTAFYVTLFTRRSQVSSTFPEPIALTQDVVDTVEADRPGTEETLQESLPTSPQASVKEISLRSSLRSSLTIAVRPVTSKTKLISRQPSYPASVTTTRTSTDSAFDSWDTSAISPQLRETVLRSSPVMARNPLSPIPGSRSPSPAKALEGPFFSPSATSTADRPSSTRSQPSSPPPTASNFNSSHSFFTISQSQPSSPVGNSGFNLNTLSGYSRSPVSRGRSSTDSLPYAIRTRSASANGPPSPFTNEDHIHPLFRSSSPTPPPSATPGTVVTAAPGSFAGLLIHERMIRRMRSGSAPNSPSPLTAGTGYFFPEDGLGINTCLGSPDSPRLLEMKRERDGYHEVVEDDKEKETDQGERKMTPPIPDFIIATGKADMTGYERRKSESIPEAE